MIFFVANLVQKEKGRKQPNPLEELKRWQILTPTKDIV
jgi:hypothetical protein